MEKKDGEVDTDEKVEKEDGEVDTDENVQEEDDEVNQVGTTVKCFSKHNSSNQNKKWGDGDVAQLVERQTSTLLRLAQFHDAARDFSPRIDFQCRLSKGVCKAPVCITCITICAHVKDPKHWQPYF